MQSVLKQCVLEKSVLTQSAVKEFLSALAAAVADMQEGEAVKLAHRALEMGLDPLTAIDLGLRAGMEEAGRRFEEDQYFIPELLVCADAMEAAMSVLKPHIKIEDNNHPIKVVIGTVEGDNHDLGKNTVAVFLAAAGYAVYDLGRDVPSQLFVEKAIEIDADIIALSTLMTTSTSRMAEVIGLLEAQNIRNRFKVIIGGKPVSKEFAGKIGADGYSADVSGALRLIRSLMD